MNKKFKVVSSLALAGMLSLNVFNAKTLAATVDDQIKTNPAGIYSSLVDGYNPVVPFVLVGSNDAVTFKEIASSEQFGNVTLFNGVGIPDDNAQVKTGDTFVADGKTYTVVVYGDVNKDGKVNSNDALMVDEHAAGTSVINNKLQLEAADVRNNAKVDSNDALRIDEFAAKLIDTVIDTLPEADKPVQQDSNYELTVGNANKVNNTNVSGADIKISLKKALNENLTGKTSVEFVGIGAKDTEDEGKEHKEVKSAIDILKDKVVSEAATQSFTNFADGIVTATVKVNNKVVTTAKITKNTVEPKANVSTNRTGTNSATITLKPVGNSDITKVYYKVVKSSVPTYEEVLKANTLTPDANSEVNEKALAGLDSTINQGYTVYYILENSYGSRSGYPNTVSSAAITSDADTVRTPVKVSEVKAPDLTKNTTAVFTWDGVTKNTKNEDVSYTSNTYKYIATLYKDGKAIASESVSGASTMSVDFKDEINEAGEGTYYVEVYIAATGSTKESEKQKSAEVKVEQLKAVSDLKIEAENVDGVKGVYLSFKNENVAEKYTNFNIKITKFDKDGKEQGTVTVNPQKGKTKYLLDDDEGNKATNFDTNYSYIAEVYVEANANQMAVIKSEVTSSDKFFYVAKINGDMDVTSNSAILTTKGVEANGQTVTYEAEIYTFTTDNRNPYHFENKVPVKIQDEKMVIPGLKENTEYVLDIYVLVNGERSNCETWVVKTLPDLSGTLTVVDSKQKANSADKIYVYEDENDSDKKKMVLNNKEYVVDDYYYGESLENTYNLINALKAGDTVSVDGNKVTIKLNGDATELDNPRNFTGVSFEDVELDITTNGYGKGISNISGAKNVTLNGENSIFKLDNVTVDTTKGGKIMVTNGVEVQFTSNLSVTVKAGAKNVTLNNVKVSAESADAALTISPSGSTLTSGALVEVVPSSSNLTFEGKDGASFEVKFKGNANLSQEQTGSVVVKAKAGTAGKVTITSQNSKVTGNVTVEAISGEVTLDTTQAGNPAITGNKEVTIPKGSTAKLNLTAKTKAPDEIANLTDFKMDYENADTLKEALDTAHVTFSDDEDGKKFEAVKAYLDSFNLTGKGATISLTTTGSETKITITFVEDENEDSTPDGAKEAISVGNIK